MTTQAPTFTQPLQSVVVLEGSTATFEAHVSGKPMCTLYLYHLPPPVHSFFLFVGLETKFKLCFYYVKLAPHHGKVILRAYRSQDADNIMTRKCFIHIYNSTKQK